MIQSAVLLTFIKLPFVIKIFVLSIFEWPLKTGFTIQCVDLNMHSKEFLNLDLRGRSGDEIPLIGLYLGEKSRKDK